MTFAPKQLLCAPRALVAQLDRAPDFESGGQGFESLPARQPVGEHLVCSLLFGAVPNSLEPVWVILFAFRTSSLVMAAEPNYSVVRAVLLRLRRTLKQRQRGLRPHGFYPTKNVFRMEFCVCGHHRLR